MFSEIINQIILECIDEALNRVSPNRKQELFDKFLKLHNLTIDDVPSHYSEFTDFLLENLPRKEYFTVLRLIIKILHERASNGTYQETNAAVAFGEIAEVNIQKTQERLKKSQETFTTPRTVELRKIIEGQEQKLRASERLSAIGQTAAMVGHDIRNPLQSIVGEVYLAKGIVDSLPDGEAKKTLTENIDVIEENLGYIDKIVSDLQDYARPIKPDLMKIDLEKIITVSLKTARIPSNIETSINVKNVDPNLSLDPNLMKRIFINLIINAVQAMPNGGKLAIKASKEADKQLIIVEDTGIGIPEGVKAKLFTPMFTTKSKGQGFGLAVSKRLVEAQGGIIIVESEPGNGARFILEF